MTESSTGQMDGPSPRERRQGAILDAAEALFIEQGYERTSLAEIVRRSGGSLATLYDLFGNKQGLLHAIATRWRDEMDEPVEAVISADRSHAETLMEYARRKIETLNSPRAVALLRMLISECLRDRDFARQIYSDMHLPAVGELSALFARWAAAGEAEIDDPEAAAELFLSITTGDSILSNLTGIDDGVLTEAQVRWRLQPFLSHFRIR